MSDLEILHSVYKKMYQEFKSSEGYITKDFLHNNLGEFTGAVLEDWCGNLFLSSDEFKKTENSEHSILFVVSASHNKRLQKGNVSYVPTKTRVGVLSNGDLVTFDSTTEKSGSQTFTGDTYIDCYSTKFTIKETLYKSELFQDFLNVSDITSEQIESVAVELAQEIIDLHEQDTFHV